jgi:ectoine hydroxylase-related dioxygenase (phytanoyl-CoA dioxygenase family)
VVLMPGEEANDRLPVANRSGSLVQDWAGDDQQWWDWYVTLAANEQTPARFDSGPGPASDVAADDAEVVAALAEPYPLTAEQRARFRAESFIKLAGVIPPRVVRRLADRLDQLLRDEHGDDNSGRFTALEQLWLGDDLMRAVALSPRLGNLAADLLGVDVRIYHDNALSKEPGCGRTPWHHDAEHFPLATLRALTAWIPLSAISQVMGPLSFARHPDLRALLGDLTFDRTGTSYDTAVSARIASSGTPVEDGPFAAGEVSFHGALCFHTAGANHTNQPRRALATTYYADGARVVDQPTLISGAWQDFLPGVLPGELAVTRLNPVVGHAKQA